MNIFDPRLWLAFIVSLALSFAAGDFHRARQDKKEYALRDANAEVEALSKVRDQSRRNVIAIDNIAAQTQKEKDHAKVQIDALRTQLRDSALRLSIPVSSCGTSGNSSDANSEARAELLPEVAERIIAIGSEADDTVRDLNACIDSYNAIRK